MRAGEALAEGWHCNNQRYSHGATIKPASQLYTTSVAARARPSLIIPSPDLPYLLSPDLPYLLSPDLVARTNALPQRKLDGEGEQPHLPVEGADGRRGVVDADDGATVDVRSRAYDRARGAGRTEQREVVRRRRAQRCDGACVRAGRSDGVRVCTCGQRTF